MAFPGRLAVLDHEALILLSCRKVLVVAFCDQPGTQQPYRHRKLCATGIFGTFVQVNPIRTTIKTVRGTK
jgi:hypothetical protein